MGILSGLKNFVFQKNYDEENYYDEFDDTDNYIYEDDDVAYIDNRRSQTRSTEPKKSDTIALTSRSSRVKDDDSVYTFAGAAASLKIVIAAPKNIDEASYVCDSLKENKTVIVNLEEVETRDSQRIMDFIAGVSYAINGDVMQITNRIFVVAPKNVEVTEHLKEQLKASGIFPSFGLKTAFAK